MTTMKSLTVSLVVSLLTTAGCRYAFNVLLKAVDQNILIVEGIINNGVKLTQIRLPEQLPWT